MCSFSVEVTSREDSSFDSAALEEIRIPRPPKRAGREKRENSSSFGGGRLVSAGISCNLKALSKGEKTSPVLGITRLR